MTVGLYHSAVIDMDGNIIVFVHNEKDRLVYSVKELVNPSTPLFFFPFFDGGHGFKAKYITFTDLNTTVIDNNFDLWMTSQNSAVKSINYAKKCGKMVAVEKSCYCLNS